ncbi:hypothetical protein INR49_005274 [Caranx melampygus]|nr:hypothetical protein INR49_005274 [Caranx melampygus]
MPQTEKLRSVRVTESTKIMPAGLQNFGLKEGETAKGEEGKLPHGDVVIMGAKKEVDVINRLHEEEVQEVVVAGLRSVAGKNGNYAVSVTPAGHSAGFGFPDTLQPKTTSHHHSIHPSIPPASVPLSMFLSALGETVTTDPWSLERACAEATDPFCQLS